VTYHFIFDVNLATHTYSIYVVVGSTQKTVGSNLKFRTEQSSNQYLNSVGTLSATGTVKLCNVVLSASSTSSSGSLVLSPSATSLNFGNVGISAGGNDQNITLKNTGTSNVTISKVTVSGAGFTANGGAAGLTLAPQQSTTVRATFDPAATGKYTGALSITSNATNSPSNIALSGTGVTSATHAITLTWQAASSGTTGYNVYVGSTSGGPYSRLNTSIVTGTSFVDAGVQSGQTYFFVVTSINSANKESPRSAEVQAAVP
jgi:Abnormal spindle-like microcephaly-assoc'd, ASPM-SPD-2-Hydin